MQAAPADTDAMRRVHQFQQLAVLQEEHQAKLLDVLAGLDASASSLPPEPEPPPPPPPPLPPPPPVSGLERSFADFGLDELRHVFPSHPNPYPYPYPITLPLPLPLPLTRHVFPSHPTAQLQQTLADCGGDVNRAAARLLAD